MDTIEVKRKEGQNIFWTLNPNQAFQAKGQMALDDIK